METIFPQTVGGGREMILVSLTPAVHLQLCSLDQHQSTAQGPLHYAIHEENLLFA